jgi:hypothetical protein
VLRSLVKRLALFASRTFRRLSDSGRLCVYLGEDCSTLCLVTGRFKRVVQMRAVLPFAASGPSSSHKLEAGLTVIETWLQAHPVRAAIDWMIGPCHVRYLLLPWDERLRDDAFCETLAAAMAAQQFTTSTHDDSPRRLRLGPLSYGRPRLAAQIRIDLIDSLCSFAARHNCRTRTIVPMLGVVWNRFFACVKSATGALALVEGKRVLRIGFENGAIISLAVQPCCADRTQIATGGGHFFFPARPKPTPEEGELALQALQSDDDVRLSYALCGAM